MASRKTTSSTSAARGEKVSSKSSASPSRKPINPAKQSAESQPPHIDKRGIPRSRVGKGAHPGNKNALGNPGGGRDPIYNPKYHPKMAEGVFLLNPQTTNKQLGELFEVQEVTIEQWKLRYPEFRRACGLKAALVDGKIARSLFRRAEGCSIRATKFFYDKDIVCPVCNGERGNNDCEHCSGSGFGKVTKIQYRENLAPDVRAAFVWLMNRQGWKENKAGEWEGKLTFGSDEDSIDVSELPVEMQKAIYEELQRKKNQGNEEGK